MLRTVLMLCAWLSLCAGQASALTMARAGQSPQKPKATSDPVVPDEAGDQSEDQAEADDPRRFGTRDPLLEKRARKNIEVAEFYARQKNFRASINRLVEIYEVYPQFTRFDRILFLLGKYHLGQRRLCEDESKRLLKQNQAEAAQLKSEEARTNDAEARRYFSELIERFPESDLVKDARKELDRLPSLSMTDEKRSPS
ncbi:MAG: hypothetical protein SNJ67_08705 [Chloracidobacterium sp.]|uniref:Outer membrane lipoprotein BamD-like domain-containing protein n=1 Tax=Chloracidobacterium validum TaxID=2821543 RepID=A0ABX8BCX5_9BACT|nr:hypothetical protein [Chloracidobacterium validum]QUW04546.1 hypothetical protein J8C06_12235 [Chloracidobacterium validum]